MLCVPVILKYSVGKVMVVPNFVVKISNLRDLRVHEYNTFYSYGFKLLLYSEHTGIKHVENNLIFFSVTALLWFVYIWKLLLAFGKVSEGNT